MLRAHDLDERGTASKLAVAVEVASDGNEWVNWLQHLRLVDASSPAEGPGVLWLQAPPSVYDWAAARFPRWLGSVATTVAGRPMECRIVAGPAVKARTFGELIDGEAGS